MFKFEKILIKVLKSTINKLEEDIQKQKEEIDMHKHNEIILLDNLAESREKIRNLENNLEFVTNNLTLEDKQKIGL